MTKIATLTITDKGATLVAPGPTHQFFLTKNAVNRMAQFPNSMSFAAVGIFNPDISDQENTLQQLFMAKEAQSHGFDTDWLECKWEDQIKSKGTTHLSECLVISASRPGKNLQKFVQEKLKDHDQYIVIGTNSDNTALDIKFQSGGTRESHEILERQQLTMAAADFAKANPPTKNPPQNDLIAVLRDLVA